MSRRAIVLDHTCIYENGGDDVPLPQEEGPLRAAEASAVGDHEIIRWRVDKVTAMEVLQRALGVDEKLIFKPRPVLDHAGVTQVKSVSCVPLHDAAATTVEQLQRLQAFCDHTSAALGLTTSEDEAVAQVKAIYDRSLLLSQSALQELNLRLAATSAAISQWTSSDAQKELPLSGQQLLRVQQTVAALESLRGQMPLMSSVACRMQRLAPLHQESLDRQAYLQSIADGASDAPSLDKLAKELDALRDSMSSSQQNTNDTLEAFRRRLLQIKVRRVDLGQR